MIVQLSLVFTEEEKQQETICVNGRELPAIIAKPLLGWADGDTSPQALDRLVRVVIGDTYILHYGPALSVSRSPQDIHVLPGYTRYVYRCISAKVVDCVVMARYTYEYCLQSKYDGKEDL